MTLVTIVHVVACVFLILVVLLQQGKGADMGAVFGGGGGSTIFGASGAGNLLTKLTTGTAVIFFVTSLVLAWSSLHRTQATVFDSAVPGPPPAGLTDAPVPSTKDGAPAPPAAKLPPADAAKAVTPAIAAPA
ncbi:MAG: preprotein translocase subunit SecG, partial [Candidatus Binatota bacterium]|nr:preprotein translocase subunit SecG [Candidatus Binatota bacterium]